MPGPYAARAAALKARLTARSGAVCAPEAELDLCPELRARLDAALEEDCPLVSRDGGFIRAGFRTELDALRELATGGKQWIANYQAAEAARTGIPNLKVGFNNVFGYYLEVTNPHRDKVPAEYHRRQTVKNAERYVTPELKEYEEKVLTADDQAKQLENELFLELRDATAAEARRLRATAQVLAEIDCLAALSELARHGGYCRPGTGRGASAADRGRARPGARRAAATWLVRAQRCADGRGGGARAADHRPQHGRQEHLHPANGLDCTDGPDRQLRAGQEAVVGVADRIFARVGASDDLARGRSTFMVEMTETARILNTATDRSLVILDEIGRGTSTYDGVSLAWSTVEYLHDQVGCRTLFATHYHELTDLAESLAQLKNLNVAVREWQDDVVFLHKIIDGPADKSYGIHVARLAGVPREVLERAKQVLAQLEQEHLDDRGGSKLAHRRRATRVGDLQLTLFAAAEHPLLDEIRKVDINELRPIDAWRY